MDSTPAYRDPDYVQGQIQALHALILAIADHAMDKESFREGALRHLETAKTSLLWSEHGPSDLRIAAIEAEKQIVRKLTE